MTNPPPLPDSDWPVFEPGSVWLVGAGPGDPGLLTLHALSALRQADAILYDALVDPRVLDWAAPGALVEYAGKRGGRPSPRQRDISLRMIELARAGHRVLRLKGGDPFVFGRGGEEVLALVDARIPFRIVPGITAGIGGLAAAGIPITYRDANQAVTFLTGHDQTGHVPDQIDWPSIAKGSPVLVLYMGVRHIAQIAEKLIAAGRSPNEAVAVVSRATLPDQTVLETTLGAVAQAVENAAPPPPTIVCIGPVVTLRRAFYSHDRHVETCPSPASPGTDPGSPPSMGPSPAGWKGPAGPWTPACGEREGCGSSQGEGGHPGKGSSHR